MINFRSPDKLLKTKLLIDKKTYDVEFIQQVTQPSNAPRLVIVAYQPNQQAQDILKTCIQTINCLTPENHELWVIDNNSPRKNLEWLLKQSNINIVLNRTEPVPRVKKQNHIFLRKKQKNQQNHGSYANAIGLEIATHLIDPQSQYFMTLHMDTMPCKNGWLSYLQSKIENKIGAVGVRMDKTRTSAGVLHVLGYMVNFQLFKKLKLNFFPRLPEYDVGDLVTIRLRQAGYEVFACPNTLWQPELTEKISNHSPLKFLKVDRSFDDKNNVIFLHLGRGIRKASGEIKNGATSEEWIKYAINNILNQT